MVSGAITPQSMSREATKPEPGKPADNRIVAIFGPYAIALAAQAVLVAAAYLIRHTFGIKIALVTAIVQVLYLTILLLGTAWLGYGPGLLVWTLTILVVPRILGTTRQGRPWDPVVFGLVLLVSRPDQPHRANAPGGGKPSWCGPPRNWKSRWQSDGKSPAFSRCGARSRRAPAFCARCRRNRLLGSGHREKQHCPFAEARSDFRL